MTNKQDRPKLNLYQVFWQTKHFAEDAIYVVASTRDKAEKIVRELDFVKKKHPIAVGAAIIASTYLFNEEVSNHLEIGEIND